MNFYKAYQSYTILKFFALKSLESFKNNLTAFSPFIQWIAHFPNNYLLLNFLTSANNDFYSMWSDCMSSFIIVLVPIEYG
jgi:hypothetical protein